MSRTLLTGIGTLYRCPPGAQRDAGRVDDAAVIWEDDTLVWVGRQQDLPDVGEARRLDAGGRTVTPGLVDCHTHLAFGGWRSDEFSMRIEGRSYLEIARAGGGIASTVAKTRAASSHELVAKARGVLDEMLSLGVTTVECKSGYGLTVEDELRLLGVYRTLNADHVVDLVPTFLGAHVVAPEHRDDPERYVRLVIEEMIPRAARDGLAVFCDVFVEDTAFSVAQARRIFAAAAQHGMRAKLHADQLTDTGGAALAAEVGAVSADHLECASPEGLAAMASAGVVGVTLPIASLYTFQTPWNASAALDAGVQVAVSTDFNPGSAPSANMHLAMMLACTLNRMTPEAVLQGVTRVAARAVGREAYIGQLAPGFAADLAVFDAPSVDHMLYQFQGRPAHATIKSGAVVWGQLSA